MLNNSRSGGLRLESEPHRQGRRQFGFEGGIPHLRNGSRCKFWAAWLFPKLLGLEFDRESS